jgi:hypothetical protein
MLKVSYQIFIKVKLASEEIYYRMLVKCGQGEPASSNRDNDFADLSARFEVTVRIDDLVEWKDSVDDWFQRVLL